MLDDIVVDQRKVKAIRLQRGDFASNVVDEIDRTHEVQTTTAKQAAEEQLQAAQQGATAAAGSLMQPALGEWEQRPSDLVGAGAKLKHEPLADLSQVADLPFH